MRRKQWEYRAQAVSVINAYAEAMNPKGATQSVASEPHSTPPRRGVGVSGDAMLKMLGAKGL